MKYAHIENTKILGWYSDDIHSSIPTPNVEVTEKIWQIAININANCYENGEFIVKDFRTIEEIAKQELEIKIQEAKNYLQSTDFKMTVDYFATLMKEKQDSLIALRAEAREFISANESI